MPLFGRGRNKPKPQAQPDAPPADGAASPSADAATGADADQLPVIAVACDAHRFDADRMLVHEPLSGTRHVLEAFAADLLDTCRRFDTLDAHAARLGEMLGYDRPEAQSLAGELRHLWQSGLLLDRDAFLQRLADRADDDGPIPIESLAMITANRTQTLRDSLPGWVDVHAQGRASRLVVYDDSRDPEVAQANRAAIADIAGERGVTAHYAGPEQKEAFARQLAERSGVDPRIIRFALFGTERTGLSYSANHNAQMLEHAGGAFTSTDDDVYAEIARPDPCGHALAMVSAVDPTEYEFFADAQAMDAAIVRDEQADLVSLAEPWLGRAVGRCVEQLDRAVDLQRAGRDLVTHLARHPLRVRVTMGGYHGDTGVGWATPFLLLGDPSRQRFLESEAAYRDAAASRLIRRSPLQPTICDRPFFMSGAFCVDHTSPLPPLGPVGRGNDRLFAQSLAAVLRQPGILHLPATFAHRPPGDRRADPDKIWSNAAYLQYSRLVARWMGELELPAGLTDPAARIDALGRRMSEVAAMPSAAFAEWVRHLQVTHYTAIHRQLDAALDRYDGEPAWWAADVERAMQVLADAAIDPPHAMPHDLVAWVGDDQAPAMTQQLLVQTGELFQAWPALFEHARQMRTEGLRMATTL